MSGQTVGQTLTSQLKEGLTPKLAQLAEFTRENKSEISNSAASYKRLPRTSLQTRKLLDSSYIFPQFNANINPEAGRDV